MLINTGTLITLETFTVSVDITNVAETTITYPAGLAYSSHVASDGSFDGTTWTISPLTGGTSETLSLTVEVTDVVAFSAGTRTVTATTTALPGETETGNNTTTRVIENLTCVDLDDCGGAANHYFNADLTSDGDHTHDGAGNTITVDDVSVFRHISSTQDVSGRLAYSELALSNDFVTGSPSGLNGHAYVYAKSNQAAEYETFVDFRPDTEAEGLVFNDDGGRYHFPTAPNNSKPNQNVGEYTATFYEGTGSTVYLGRTPNRAIYAKRITTITDANSPYTVDPSIDELIFVDNSAGAVVINFPQSGFVNPSTTASLATRMGVSNSGSPSWNASHQIVVKVLSDPSTFNVTLEPNGAETIQDIGASPTANLVINGAGDIGGVWRIVTDGSNLHVI